MSGFTNSIVIALILFSASVEIIFIREAGASSCAFCAFLSASIALSSARALEMKSVPTAAVASEMQNRYRFIRQGRRVPWLCNRIQTAKNEQGLANIHLNELS